jgi:hypothetical protein
MSFRSMMGSIWAGVAPIELTDPCGHLVAREVRFDQLKPDAMRRWEVSLEEDGDVGTWTAEVVVVDAVSIRWVGLLAVEVAKRYAGHMIVTNISERIGG